MKLADDQARIATLTWSKVYTIVNDGPFAVHSRHKISQEQINSVLNGSWQNVLYVDRLPGSRSETGELLPVSLIRKRDWNKGAGFKLTVHWDIKVQEGSFIVGGDAIRENRALNGLITGESTPGSGGAMKYPTIARGILGLEGSEDDVIYAGDQVFGKDPLNITITEHGVSETDLIVHEMGHNFGRDHKKGDYSQEGLQDAAGSYQLRLGPEPAQTRREFVMRWRSDTLRGSKCKMRTDRIPRTTARQSAAWERKMCAYIRVSAHRRITPIRYIAS
ncbi:MAG: hypothetical protein IPH63_09610 [Flavobacteriales bacterium]|nr:hypothetical protein [Flavobacteriales bacterium]